MIADRDLQARRYLLRDLPDDEVDRLELEYLAKPAALEIVEAAEERLIDEYLDHTLPADDRGRFEAHYLASAPHRERVDTIRRLRAAAHSGARPQRLNIRIRTLALAAGLVLAIAGVVWVVAHPRGAPPPELAQQTTVPPAPPATPRMFAVAIPPVTVRGASETPALIVPAGTDVIELKLEGDGAGPPLTSGRVEIRTVAGSETWKGSVQAGATLPPGFLAHAEVPAARLVPDDYVITLFDVGPTGAESERSRYFLRVRR